MEKTKGLDLGAEPSHIEFCRVPSPCPRDPNTVMIVTFIVQT